MKVKVKKKVVKTPKVKSKHASTKSVEEGGEPDPRWEVFEKYYLDKDFVRKNKKHTYRNAQESGLEAGFSDGYCNKITTSPVFKLFRARVRQTVAEALEDIGVDADYLANKTKVLLDQEYPIVDKKTGKVLMRVADAKAINFGLNHALGVRGETSPQVVVDVNIKQAVERVKKALPD